MGIYGNVYIIDPILHHGCGGFEEILEIDLACKGLLEIQQGPHSGELLEEAALGTDKVVAENVYFFGLAFSGPVEARHKPANPFFSSFIQSE